MWKIRLVSRLFALAVLVNAPAFAATTADEPSAPEQWSAKWIGYPDDDSDKTPEPAPEFRKSFSLDAAHGSIVRATLWITGLGAYDCRINGRTVSQDVLAPGWTDYRKTVLFNRLNVTGL